MGIAKLRKRTHMSQRQFADAFSIPVRTLQQWEQGKSSPAPYVVEMIEKLLDKDIASEKNLESSASIENDRHSIPKKTRWKVCISDPFPNCDRIYPIQQRKVKEVLDGITGNPAVKRAVVFGSSTTGKCHIGSDIDIYVEMENNSNPLQKSFDFPVDLWTNFTADEHLMKEIESKGVVVYG